MSSADATVLGARQAARLEDLGGAGCLVRLLDGPRAGLEVVVPAAHLDRIAVRDERPPSGGGPPGAPCDPDARTAAASRAEGLLRSLLTPSQRHQRAATDTFWVHNDHGWFRLGALYDIRFRSARRPWVERSVCVVSEDHLLRPDADLWAELVVVLRADPAQVVDVANWHHEDPPRPPCSDRAGLVRWLALQRDEHRRRRARGDELHAAYLAYDVAERLVAIGRPSWAVPYRQSARRGVIAWIERWPDEAAALEHAHTALLSGSCVHRGA